MLRKLFGAAFALAFSTAGALAIPVFDGTMAFVAGSNNCGSAGQTFPAIYRPQQGTGTKSGLIFFLYRSGAGFTRATNGQFNGAGAFAGVLVTANATVAQRTGTFNITQVPANVTAATQEVTLDGTFTPSDGCRFIFKATFLRRPGT